MRRNSLSRYVMFGLVSWLGPLAFTVVLTPTIVLGLGLESYGVYALAGESKAIKATTNVTIFMRMLLPRRVVDLLSDATPAE